MISCCHYHCHINDLLFLLFAIFRHQTWAVPKSSPRSDLEQHRNRHLHGDPKSAKWNWYAHISGTREQEHSIFLLVFLLVRLMPLEELLLSSPSFAWIVHYHWWINVLQHSSTARRWSHISSCCASLKSQKRNLK